MLRRFGFWVGLALGLQLLVGFIAFAILTDRLAANAQLDTPADGIVALTGGSGERIVLAAKLYRAQKGRRLLVSGVNPKVSQSDLIHLSGLQSSDFTCCVDIDVQALNTRGNAHQIVLWAKQYQYKHVLVVTSNYHMPRALLELKKLDPNIQWIAAPARSTGAAKQHKFRRTLLEYGKYLVVLFTNGPNKELVK